MAVTSLRNIDVILLLTALFCLPSVGTNQDSNNILQFVAEFVEDLDPWNSMQILTNVSAIVKNVKFEQFILFLKLSLHVGVSTANPTKSLSGVQSNKCSEDIEYVLDNLKSGWAISLMDASGKIPSGMLRGNLLWIGNFRECLKTYAPPEKGSSRGDFHGQYCRTVWNFTPSVKLQVAHVIQLPIKFGLCIPETCSDKEIAGIIQSMMKLLGKLLSYKQYEEIISLDSIDCNLNFQTPDESVSSFFTMLGVYLLFTLIATAVTLMDSLRSSQRQTYKKLKASDTEDDDLNTEKSSTNSDDEKSTTMSEGVVKSIRISDSEKTPTISRKVEKPSNKDYAEFTQYSEKERINSCQSLQKDFVSALKKVLKCFCFFTNGTKLFDTEVHSEEILRCIHGIKFLSMAWVTFGHACFFPVYLSVTENIIDVGEEMDTWSGQLILKSTFGVDSFFLLSGFLLAYLYLGIADKLDGKTNWLALCFIRYIRLTPVLFVVTGLNSFVFKYVGKGPFWNDASDIEHCKENWWWNIIYINNFLPFDSICAVWTWFLACDTQIFLLCSLFLYTLWRLPKYGLAIYTSLLLSSWIVTWRINDINQLQPPFFGATQTSNPVQFRTTLTDFWDHVYTRPYCRIGPYLIGVYLAFVLHKTGRDVSIKWWIQVFGWCASAFCCLSVIFGLHKVSYNQQLFNFYNALSPSIFTLGVAWVIYACVTGHGGPVNYILSLKIWIPLSRATFCAYMFHPFFMKWYWKSLKAPYFFTDETLVLLYIGFMVLSYCTAFVMTLLFEAPIINLQRQFVKV